MKEMKQGKKNVLHGITLLFSVLSIIAVVSVANGASKYPNKPIDVIIGAPAGGGGDVLLRIITNHLSREIGKPIIVVNKPGGGGIPAILDGMKAQPDGYTLMCETQAFSSFQIGRTDIPFDPLERTFICKIALSPYALFCDSKLPWKNLDDVARFIKEQPEKFAWGAMGGPSGTTFSQLQFFDLIKADLKKMKMVVYKGSGPILTAVAGGHIMFGSAAASAVPPFQQAGNVRPLVITKNKTLKKLPGVPSAKDAGFPGLTVDMWLGLSGPLNLPPEVINTLNEAVKKMIHSQEFIADLENTCSFPAYEDSETLKKSVTEEGYLTKKMLDILSW